MYNLFLDFLKFLKTHWVAGVLSAGVLAAGGGWILWGNSAPVRESATVVRADISREISLTGKTKPSRSAELSFENAGKISAIFAKEGESVSAGAILARQNAGTANAEVAQAEAAMREAEAALAIVKRGMRSEEIAVKQSAADRAGVSFQNALRDVKTAAADAFTKADDAVRSKADKFFLNPGSAAPDLAFSVSDGWLKETMENERAKMTVTLSGWAKSLAALSSLSPASSVSVSPVSANGESEILSAAKTSQENLSRVKNFLDTATLALTAAIVSPSVSQAAIDGYRADVSAARMAVSTSKTVLEAALRTESDARAALSLAQSELALAKSPAAPEDVAQAEARLADTRASLENARTRAAKFSLAAPISGVVTRVDPKVGEIAAPNVPIIFLQSRSAFEVEAFISETDIALVPEGAEANITLDSYGDAVSWQARVMRVNPSETLVEGVSTYKTIFAFTEENDPRIKSGMTANITLVSQKKEGVLAVPRRFVYQKDGGQFVSVEVVDKTNNKSVLQEKAITTGISGSNGMIEITGGLEEGERVVLPDEIR